MRPRHPPAISRDARFFPLFWLQVMTTVAALRGAAGCTLVVTIHQPSPAIYALFDGLLLLSHGQTVYFGPGGERPCAFFQQLGFPHPPGWNIPEFFLDLVSGPASCSASPPQTTASQPGGLFAAAYAASPLAAQQAAAAARAQARGISRRAAQSLRAGGLGTPGGSDEEAAMMPPCGSATKKNGSPDDRETAWALEPPSAAAVALPPSSPLSACIGLLPAPLPQRQQLYANSAVREVFTLLRFRGINHYAAPMFVFSRVLLFGVLAGLFASFYYDQRMDVLGVVNVGAMIFLTVSTPTYVASMYVQELTMDREVRNTQPPPRCSRLFAGHSLLCIIVTRSEAGSPYYCRSSCPCLLSSCTQVYTREFHEGAYRAGSYVAAKLLTELPMSFLGALAWSSVLCACSPDGGGRAEGRLTVRPPTTIRRRLVSRPP